jgi:hypothetical protein
MKTGERREVETSGVTMVAATTGGNARGRRKWRYDRENSISGLLLDNDVLILGSNLRCW